MRTTFYSGTPQNNNNNTFSSNTTAAHHQQQQQQQQYAPSNYYSNHSINMFAYGIPLSSSSIAGGCGGPNANGPPQRSSSSAAPAAPPRGGGGRMPSSSAIVMNGSNATASSPLGGGGIGYNNHNDGVVVDDDNYFDAAEKESSGKKVVSRRPANRADQHVPHPHYYPRNRCSLSSNGRCILPASITSIGAVGMGIGIGQGSTDIDEDYYNGHVKVVTANASLGDENNLQLNNNGAFAFRCDSNPVNKKRMAMGNDHNTNNNTTTGIHMGDDDGDGDETNDANTTSPYDPRYFTLTMPNLPPHRYRIANVGSRMPHMTYNIDEIETIATTHRKPQTCADKFSICLVKFVGFVINTVTRFDPSVVGTMPMEQWVSRAVFLESVAAVPGMIAAMVRHLDSLRRMKRDHGWVRHLLEEADNERMHLFFFLREKNPSLFFRFCVWFTQLGFLVMNVVFYLVSPRTMHRFVGYLEEEAVHTYNCMVVEMDHPNGSLQAWRTKPAPKDMAAYYCLEPDMHRHDYHKHLLPRGGGSNNNTAAASPASAAAAAVGGVEGNRNTAATNPPPTNTAPYIGPTYRDIVLCIRADETGHREHNHMFSDLHGTSTERMIPREELELVTHHHNASNGNRHKNMSGNSSANGATGIDGVTCVLRPNGSNGVPASSNGILFMAEDPTARVVSPNTPSVNRMPSPLPMTMTSGGDGHNPLTSSPNSTTNNVNGGVIPIRSPAEAQQHARNAQHLFTTSVSITDPFYIEV